MIAGKSSLINAILDSPGLASAGSTRSAMTSVITEFMAASAVQETPFQAEVELFENERIQQILEDHLQAYCRFYLEDTEELDEDELMERKTQAQTALEAFLALFASRAEFRDEDSAANFFGNFASIDDTTILAQLSTWTQYVMLQYKPRNGSIYLTANTAEKLNRRLEPWVTTIPIWDVDGCSRSPSLWPIVRSVKVGMQSTLLQRGIVIADLPG